MGLPEDVGQDVINYLNSRPLYIILDKYILVHAGIGERAVGYNNIQEYMSLQSRQELLWSREEFYSRPTGISDYTVIFGHTPTHYCYSSRGYVSKPMSIWYDDMYKDKIGIDCCANVVRLSCLRLDDMDEFYTD